jgi:hypothetical protein
MHGCKQLLGPRYPRDEKGIKKTKKSTTGRCSDNSQWLKPILDGI